MKPCLAENGSFSLNFILFMLDTLRIPLWCNCFYQTFNFTFPHPSISSVLRAAVWVFMTLLPTLMLNSQKRDVPLGTRDYVGWALWGFGFATEAIADQQKWIFKSDPNNAVSQRALVTVCASSSSAANLSWFSSITRGSSSRVDSGPTAGIPTTLGRSCSGPASGWPPPR